MFPHRETVTLFSLAAAQGACFAVGLIESLGEYSVLWILLSFPVGWFLGFILASLELTAFFWLRERLQSPSGNEPIEK
jgi:hypothetical protein